MALKKGWNEIEVKKLVKAGWNYKDEDTEEAQQLMDKLEANFKRNGQIENILVRELDTGFYEVVNGNHRYDVAVRLKIKKLMCFNLGDISEAQAKRIALETNETKFKADQIKLAKTVTELLGEFDDGELLTTLPFSEKEVEDFDKLLNFTWEDDSDNGNSSSSGGSDPSDWKAMRYDLPVQVAEQLEEQVNRFKKLLYPEETSLKNVSYVVPMEAMIQILAQTPDNHILGEK